MKKKANMKKAVAASLNKQDAEATTSRYNKLSTLLSTLGGEEDPLDVAEFGEPVRDTMVTMGEDKALRTMMKRRKPRE